MQTKEAGEYVCAPFSKGDSKWKMFIKIDEFLKLSKIAFSGICHNQSIDPKGIYKSGQFYEVVKHMSLPQLKQCNRVSPKVAQEVFDWKSDYRRRLKAEAEERKRLAAQSMGEPQTDNVWDTIAGNNSQPDKQGRPDKEHLPLFEGIFGVTIQGLLSNPNIDPNSRDFNPERIVQDATHISLLYLTERKKIQDS